MATKTLQGFYTKIGNKGIFLESSLEKKSKTVVDRMIESVGKVSGAAPFIIEHNKENKACRESMQQKMAKATLDNRMTSSGQPYVTIYGDGFCDNFQSETYGDLIIVREKDVDNAQINGQEHIFGDRFDRELEYILHMLQTTNQPTAVITISDNPMLKDYKFLITPIPNK